MDYTLSLSSSQQKAMEYIAVSPQEWIENAVFHRAEIGIKEICSLYVEYKIQHNEPITAQSADQIVEAAFTEGIVKTAAQIAKEQVEAFMATQAA